MVDKISLRINRITGLQTIRKYDEFDEGKKEEYEYMQVFLILWFFDIINHAFKYLIVFHIIPLFTISLLFQVANYGIGGHYSAHQDPMFVYKEPTDAPVYNIEEDPHIKRDAYITGDRMSTFMIYLSEVHLK